MTELIKWGYLFVFMQNGAWHMGIGELHDYRTDCEQTRAIHASGINSAKYEYWISKECTKFRVTLQGKPRDGDPPPDVFLSFERSKK
jgi:hypothetical protein